MGGGEFRLALAARILVILCIGVDDQGIGRDARGEGDLGFVIREDLASDVPYLRERFGFEGVVGRGEEIPVLVLAFDSKVVLFVAVGFSQTILHDGRHVFARLPGEGGFPYLGGEDVDGGDGGRRFGGEGGRGRGGKVTTGVGGVNLKKILGGRDKVTQNDRVIGNISFRSNTCKFSSYFTVISCNSELHSSIRLLTRRPRHRRILSRHRPHRD